MAKAGVPHDPKRMDAWDIEVGRRIRARRLECEMSQETLADGLGVSFQQVQKYEKGVNRVGAARMRRICETLKVPITFFYDAEIAGGSTGVKRFKASRLFVLLQRRDSVKLVTAFNDVRDPRLRASLLRVVVQAGKLDASRRAACALGAVMIGALAFGAAATAFAKDKPAPSPQTQSMAGANPPPAASRAKAPADQKKAVSLTEKCGDIKMVFDLAKEASGFTPGYQTQLDAFFKRKCAGNIPLPTDKEDIQNFNASSRILYAGGGIVLVP